MMTHEHIFRLQGVKMPERGESKSDMNKLIDEILGALCKTGNLQLGQITEAPSTNNNNKDPKEVEKREKSKKEAVDNERKKKGRKLKEKEEKERKEKEQKEIKEKGRIENERLEKEKERKRTEREQLQQMLEREQKGQQRNILLFVMVVVVIGTLFLRKK